MTPIRFTYPKLHYSLLLLQCLFTGQWIRIYREAHYRLYRLSACLRFILLAMKREENKIDLTEIHIAKTCATDSLDNIHPKGALSTIGNPGFLLEMDRRLKHRPRWLDLGCAQGTLVKAARMLGWESYGIDGAASVVSPSRFIFNGDITEHISASEPFDMVTAWEVLEHIPMESIPSVVNNIVQNLKPTGLFIASTNDEPELHCGVDLHVTKLTNAQWKKMFNALSAGRLMEVDLGLKPHQYARQNFKNPSFLVYQRI